MAEYPTVYTIEPWKPYSGDSGQINGLSGSGGYRDEPVRGEDGNWLLFDSYEEAEIAAIELGYDRGDVEQRILMTLKPDASYV